LNKPRTYTPLPIPIPIQDQVWPSNTEPLVHVRTMVFNHEKYIRTCLDSILMQKTTFPVRILIHDDASTDESSVILSEYANRYPELIWIYTQTENIYKIKNLKKRLLKRQKFNAWRVCPYEALCEGDDFWTDPMKLQIQAEFLENNPNYVAISHATVIQNENGRTATANDFWELLNQDTDFDLSRIVQQKVPFHTSSFFFRSHIIPRITAYPHRAKSGDWILFSIVAMEGKIRYIHRKMSVYRTHTHGITSTENHFDTLNMTLSRYQMWQQLKRYSLTKEHILIFEKMIRYQHKYLIYDHKVKSIIDFYNILHALLIEKEWLAVKQFLKEKIKQAF
jgi:glycosyltransferase involved in cell wall biosynthesis